MSRSGHAPLRRCGVGIGTPVRGAVVAATLAVALTTTGSRQARADEVGDAPFAYGNAGTTELSVQLGLGSGGFAAGGGFRHYVVRGLAPGLEGSYHRHDGRSQGLLFGTLRLAPLRVGSVVPVLTARAGRVFMSNHANGWAVGGDVGILLFASPHVAFEVGYGVLRLLPASFCADLTSCTVYQPVLGLRVSF
ncbi:MAG TPA: hypothetical protein VGG33_13935 [Polyangia bacterium]